MSRQMKAKKSVYFRTAENGQIVINVCLMLGLGTVVKKPLCLVL